MKVHNASLAGTSSFFVSRDDHVDLPSWVRQGLSIHQLCKSVLYKRLQHMNEDQQKMDAVGGVLCDLVSN